MRLVTYEIATPLGRHQRLGAVLDGAVADLNFAYTWLLAEEGEKAPYELAHALVPSDMLAFLQRGDRAMQEARRVLAALQRAHPEEGPNGETLVHDPVAIRLLAPLPRPNSLRDFYGFEEHVKTGFAKRGEAIPAPWYEMPVYYKGNARTIIGPDETVIWPRFTEQPDFELELACVIGQETRNVSPGEAASCIAGYTIMNDFSARDIQRKEMLVRLGPAKGKDFATALGPALVTPDELPDLKNLPCRVKVNGTLWSESNAGQAHWSFEEMIAHASMDETLYPGDVLGSGTVGRGCGLELDRWIGPGDLVALEIDGLGVLKNRMGRPVQSPAVK